MQFVWLPLEPHAEPDHRLGRPTHYWPKDFRPKQARLGLKARSITVNPLIINNRTDGGDRRWIC